MKREYHILTAGSAVELQERVQELVARNEGWEPLGGVTVSSETVQWENGFKGTTGSDTYETWAQAMLWTQP